MIATLKLAGAAMLVAGSLGLVSTANAAPAAGATGVAGNLPITQVAQGCGPGFGRGAYGRCRPFAGPGRAWGRRCFVRPTPFGPRRLCRY